MSLTSLPNELILHLFKSFDDVNEAAILSHTSRHFHTIWRYNLTSIYDAILAKVIGSYSQFCQLAEARANSDLVVNQLSVDDRAKAATVRAQVMLNDEDLADCALAQFEGHIDSQWSTMEIFDRLDQCACAPTSRNRRRFAELRYILKQFTRDRFWGGFLRAMSILYLAGKGGTRMYKFLISMNLLNFFAMVEVMEWYVYDYGEGPEACEDIQVAGYDSRPWRPEFNFPDGYLAGRTDGLRFLEVVRTGLVKVSGVEPPFNDRFQSSLETGLMSYQLILHEDCKKYNTDAAEFLALVDLLPLLPENCSVGPDYELSLPHISKQLSSTVTGGKELGSCNGRL